MLRKLHILRGLLLIAASIILTNARSAAQDLPSINLDFSSYAVTSDGRVLGYYGEQHRVDLKSTSNVSKYVIQCLIATEDRDFYNHHGVSFKGILRGILKTITGSTQGGSTLTMQLARNLFLSNERTISRKVKEIELAEELEKKYTKDEILLMYLNTVYFGRGAYGIWTAAEEYFNKTPDKLSMTESAALVGMVQSPNGYDPVKHPGRMLNRRNEVLHNLVEVGKLQSSEFEKLKEKPLGLVLNENLGGQFLEYIRKQAVEILGPGGMSLNKDQLKITTTLNYNIQKAAEDAVEWQWERFPDRMKDAQIGLVSIEPGTGMIRAMIGGNPDAPPRGLNRAVQIKRQPGSSFKAFLYGSLLERGYTLATPLQDKPIVIDSGMAFEWRPTNDDETYTDTTMPMQSAIQNSVNLCAAYAITGLTTPDSVVSFAHRMGIQSPVSSYPSIALGTEEVAPIEMASSYAVFAGGGVYSPPISILKIADKNGKVLYSRSPDSSAVLDSATAYLITTALETVVNNGTAYTVRQYYNGTAAGKTGTTQNFTDAWFVGYNPKLSTAIWIGFDNPKKKLGGGFQYGGTACAPIWGKMMAEVSSKIPDFASAEFKRPSTVKDTALCLDNGMIASGDCIDTKVYPINIIKLPEDVNKKAERKWYDVFPW